MKFRIVGIIALAAAAALSSCKPRRSASAVRDVNEPQPMSSVTGIAEDPKIKARIPVLIYYANDTYYSVVEDKGFENLNVIREAILKGAADPNIGKDDKVYLEQVAQRLRDDWLDFMRAVDTEAHELQNNVCRRNARYKMGLAVFRNANMPAIRNDEFETDRDVSWSYCKPDDKGGIEGPTSKFWTIRWFEDFRYDSQPLSHPRVFESAIQQVREVFPPEKYKYILLTKSHGSKEMSITPNLVIDASRLEADQIKTALLDHKKRGAATQGGALDDIKTLMPTLASFNGVNAALAPLAGSSGRFPADQVGVSKRRYLEVINQEGGGDPTSGMYFPLIFMESCNSQLQSSSDAWIRDTIVIGYDAASKQEKISYAGLNIRNVGKLYTSNTRGLAYRTLRYAEMFAGLEYNSFIEIQQAISYQLDRLRQQQTSNGVKQGNNLTSPSAQGSGN